MPEYAFRRLGEAPGSEEIRFLPDDERAVTVGERLVGPDSPQIAVARVTPDATQLLGCWTWDAGSRRWRNAAET
jgi:hypothetical protein